jgi:hypothetical protein
MPPDIESDIPGLSVGNAAIISMQQLHTPINTTVEGSARRRDISMASIAEPTANSVSDVPSSQPCGRNAYSLIMSRRGSRSEVTCSVAMATAPPAVAANPPAAIRFIMPLTFAGGMT